MLQRAAHRAKLVGLLNRKAQSHLASGQLDPGGGCLQTWGGGSMLQALASSFVLVSFSRKKPVSWGQEAPVAFSPRSTSLETTEGSVSPRASSYRWDVFVLGPAPTPEFIMEARRTGCSGWPDKSCAYHRGAVSPTEEPHRPRGAVCGKGRSHWMPKT